MTRTRALPVLLVATILPAAPAVADVVHLRTGGVLEGRVTRQEDRVRVETTQGTVTVEPADIDRIEAREAPQDEYLRRKAALPEGDADARVALARWCAGKRMAAAARAELEEAVRLAPDHAEARRLLGHVRWDGAWMTEAEAKRAQGLVLVDGTWLPADVAEAQRHRKEEERRHKAIEAELLGAARRMTSASPDVREQGHRAAVDTVARRGLPPEVKAWADAFKAECDRAWAEVESRRVVLEIRATQVEFQGFRRVLIAPPINAVLQLPFATRTSYQGTVVVPAGSR